MTLLYRLVHQCASCPRLCSRMRYQSNALPNLSRALQCCNRDQNPVSELVKSSVGQVQGRSHLLANNAAAPALRDGVQFNVIDRASYNSRTGASQAS